MKINIIGWYGTETMGDIAILDGIIRIFSALSNNCAFFIGSLYPFYTERTLLYNMDVFRINNPEISVSVYDVKDRTISKEYIKDADIVVIGGGPLMTIGEILTIRHAWEEAIKSNKTRIVLGCGIGPVKEKRYLKHIKYIIKHATAIVLRDNVALDICKENNIDVSNAVIIGDPAIVSIEEYMGLEHGIKGNCSESRYITVNFREYPQYEYGLVNQISENELIQLLEYFASIAEVRLVPMHTFVIGNDDRYYLAHLSNKIENGVSVLYEPMNLHEMYTLYKQAYGCCGMRYHSIVMQTLLNGNNIVLNYTDKKWGKIIGFLKGINNSEFYNDRVINIEDGLLGKDIISYADLVSTGKKYNYMKSKMKERYVEFLKEIVR